MLAAEPMPSLLSRLVARGLSLNLSGVSSATIPMPSRMGPPAGSWVAENNAIRVIKPTLTSATLVPRKVATISTLT
ncbi:MAG TPA: hypothetical protein VIT62_10745, partial [Lysobacter sp.]